MLRTGIAVERVLFANGPRGALRRLGFGSPGGRALLAAGAVGALVQLVYPITSLLTGATLTLRPGWPWLLIGIFACHGLAEVLVWRGYSYRRLLAGRSFRSAVMWTMPLVAVVHVPIVITSGPPSGAPAVLHTAIDSITVLLIPAAALTTFSLSLSAVGILVPLLVLVVPRSVLRTGE